MMGFKNRVALAVLPSTVAAVHRTNMLGFLVSAYVTLLPIQIPVNMETTFAPSDLFLILMLLLAPGQLKYHKPVWTIWHFALLMAFAAASFVTALSVGSLSRYVWLNKDVGLLTLFLSYAAITSIATDWDQVRRILRVYTLSVVIQNQVAVGAFLLAYFYGVNFEPLFTSYNGARLSGLLLDANAYGGLLALALVICEGASWGGAPLIRGGLLLYCRLNLSAGILFTFSRSAWISLGLALLLLCAVRFSVAIRLALLGLAGTLCVLLFMGQRFVSYFEGMAGRPEQGVSRFDLIRDALTQFAQHPVLGSGLGSFVETEGMTAHNTALWFLADFGIVGLSVLLGFLGWFFIAGWSGYRKAPQDERPVVLALLLGHTAMLGLAMGIEAFYQRHWWVVLALIAASSATAEERRRFRTVPLDRRLYACERKDC